MYQLATCRATIFRGAVPNEFGDLKASNVPVVKGVLASIIESDQRVWETTTQTPRVVRIVSGTFPYGTDIQPNDRVRDDTHGVDYWVVSVAVRRAAGSQPDLGAELRRVGTS